MRIPLRLLHRALIGTLMAFATTANFAAQPGKSPTDSALYDQIAALDAQVFDSFNHCSEPAQLKKHASFFASNVEFCHDTGGVTWSRRQMLANTQKYACGHYTRELIQGSLQVYPVKEFGAISHGSHRFCQVPEGLCEGMADFTIVWRLTGTRWEITRVLSYGHRSTATETPARGP